MYARRLGRRPGRIYVDEHPTGETDVTGEWLPAESPWEREAIRERLGLRRIAALDYGKVEREAKRFLEGCRLRGHPETE